MDRVAVALSAVLAACTEERVIVYTTVDHGAAVADVPDAGAVASADSGAVVELPKAPSTFSVPCPADLAVFAETEPNDHWSKSNDLGLPSAPGFCVQGTVLCGNDGKDGYANKGDHVVFQLAAPANATLALSWKTSSDFDLLVSSDFDKGSLLVTFKSGIGVAEGGTAALVAKTPYYVSINCWDGAPGDYALVVRW